MMLPSYLLPYPHPVQETPVMSPSYGNHRDAIPPHPLFFQEHVNIAIELFYIAQLN
jgi:hypothetical protein